MPDETRLLVRIGEPDGFLKDRLQDFALVRAELVAAAGGRRAEAEGPR